MKTYGIIGYLLFTIPALAQSGLEVSSEFLGAVNTTEQRVWHKSVESDFTPGFGFRMAYVYLLDDMRVELVGELGYKQLYLSGESGSSRYNGTTSKILGSLGFRYCISDSWFAGLSMDVENNRDLREFRTKTSDNLRYSPLIRILYRLPVGLGFWMGYSRAVYPLEDQYIIFNPVQQFSIGLNYRLL